MSFYYVDEGVLYMVYFLKVYVFEFFNNFLKGSIFINEI